MTINYKISDLTAKKLNQASKSSGLLKSRIIEDAINYYIDKKIDIDKLLKQEK